MVVYKRRSCFINGHSPYVLKENEDNRQNKGKARVNVTVATATRVIEDKDEAGHRRKTALMFSTVNQII